MDIISFVQKDFSSYYIYIVPKLDVFVMSSTLESSRQAIGNRHSVKKIYATAARSTTVKIYVKNICMLRFGRYVVGYQQMMAWYCETSGGRRRCVGGTYGIMIRTVPYVLLLLVLKIEREKLKNHCAYALRRRRSERGAAPGLVLPVLEYLWYRLQPRVLYCTTGTNLSSSSSTS